LCRGGLKWCKSDFRKMAASLFYTHTKIGRSISKIC